MKLGFIGLGSMGSGMARNLMRAGHEVTVFNRTRSKAEELGREGAAVADTPAAACNGEAVFSMLADDHAVAEVVSGPHGILTCPAKDFTHFSMSTISAEFSRRLSELHRKAGQGYVASPVFGRPEAAAQGKLVVVAGGSSQLIERFRPALEAMGQRLAIAGEQPEKANLIKICGNFMIASALETMSEAFAVLRKSDVQPAQFLEIVNGLFRSPVYENYGKAIAAAQFEPAGFKLRLGLKDVKLALSASDEVSAPMPLASLLRDQYLGGVAKGYGDLDWSAVARVVAENAGLG